MARFHYIYKTSDGVRHEAEISAPSRDEAFVALRGQGIRPIKVVAKNGSRANGEIRGVRKRVVVVVALTAALAASGVMFLLHARQARNPAASADLRPVKYALAVALARQEIPGDRWRIEHAATNLFKCAAEAYLARFAEPGRPFSANGAEPPSEAEFRACLKEPIRVASNEFSEQIDLKRIVTGMKKELRAYLMGGGTLRDYLAELAKRQNHEISCRKKAEARLTALLDENRPNAGIPHPGRGAKRRKQDLERAYDFWLKANAQLKSMGIHELALPEALRNYQTTLDFQEY